jgi:hypothetical protein
VVASGGHPYLFQEVIGADDVRPRKRPTHRSARDVGDDLPSRTINTKGLGCQLESVVANVTEKSLNGGRPRPECPAYRIAHAHDRIQGPPT